MDVKTTVLNGEIEEEVYIEQPDRFVIHEKESHVCRLKIDGYLMSLGFSKIVVDPNLLQHCW
jgi:hypothetical protein